MLPFEFLSQLAEQPLPQEISEPDDIDMVRMLCSEGLVDAQVPLSVGLESIYSYRRSARVYALTARGQQIVLRAGCASS